MVDSHFTTVFRETLCQFPDDPCDRKNPMLLGENISKLWVHQVFRIIHDLKTATPAENTNPSELSLADFCTISIDSFCKLFLSLFGISPDFLFQCHALDDKGLSSSVCSAALRADEISSHVQEFHISPLELDPENTDKELRFSPFSLVFHGEPTALTHEKCDLGVLKWARHTRKCRDLNFSSYLELLQSLKVPFANLFEPSSRSNSARGKGPLPQKRKRSVSGDDDAAAKKKSQLQLSLSE